MERKAKLSKEEPLDLKCFVCGKKPEEITEYIEAAVANDTTVEDYVKTEEGTYNKENGHFCCTDCYIKIGMPSSDFGWIAP